MQRRALQALLLVVMAIFLVEYFTNVQAASCDQKLEKKTQATKDIGTQGHAGADAPIAFQVHGGDNTFGDGLRAEFKAEVARRIPGATLVDGPPPKNGVLVRLTLTSADLRWTPFYSHEGLGMHDVIQLPGARSGTQITADADVNAVCKGLVSKERFSTHNDVTGPIAAWLVDELVAARGDAPKAP